MYELTHTKTRSQCFKRAPLWSGDCFRKPALSCPKTVPFIKRRKNIFVFKNIPTRVDGAKEWRHGQMELDEFLTVWKIWQDTSFKRDSSVLRSIHKVLCPARRLNFCTRLKSEFAFFQSLSRLSQLAYFVSFCQIQANHSGVEFLRTISKLRKTKKISWSLVCVLHKTWKTGHSHVVVVQ